MGAIVLGRMHLRWCEQCDLPILEQPQCGACGAKTREVKITPPGDARPAFKDDILRIRALIDEQFGDGTGETVIPHDRITLLNKAPDIDRTDEVIVGGEVVGAVRFGLLSGQRFMLRPSSAAAIAPLVKKNWVRVDSGAARAVREKNASTLAVGVTDCDPDIVPGSEVLVLDSDNKALSVGVSKMAACEMKERKRGTAVKTRWRVDAETLLAPGKKASWADAVIANKETLASRAEQAKRFIRKVVSENDLPVAVSYSGGKDSLATLLLVLDAGLRPKLLFIDTGLEFEETKRNVRLTAKEYDLELLVGSAGDSFWKNLDHFGPPAKDFRWCCKTCKLGPATQLIQQNFPKGVLSFIGQRAYESQQRAAKGSVWRNPWTPNQLAASPIQKWTALHVWLYLISKEAKVNSLYEKGLERIGCYMCPASDLAELRRVQEIAPEYQRWQEFLKEHARRNELPNAWLAFDLWRWRRLPKSVLDEFGEDQRTLLDARSKTIAETPLEFRSTSGYSPCIEGLSMEGVFSNPLPMDRVTNLLTIMGEVTSSPDGNIAEVCSVTVFGEGPVMIKAKDEQDLKMKAAKVREIVFRSVNCAGCGICVARCRVGALRLDGLVKLEVDKCTHCGECLGPCPAVRFRDEELDI